MTIQNNPRKEIFVDELNLGSLLYLVIHARSFSAIWHFENHKLRIRYLVEFLRQLGLIPREVHQVKHRITVTENIRSQESTYRVCSAVKDEEIASNSLVQIMGSAWPREKILLYFHKLIEAQVRSQCLQICLFRRIISEGPGAAPANFVLLIRKHRWSSYVKNHAGTEGVQSATYRRLPAFRTALKVPWWILWSGRIIAPALVLGVGKRLRRTPPTHLESATLDSGKDGATRPSGLSIDYHHQELSFDPTVRSEFFWLNESGIPYSEVMVHGYVGNESRTEIDRRRIKLFGRCPGVPMWIPTQQMLIVFLRLAGKLMVGTVSGWRRGRIGSPYYAINLLILSARYSYWHNFFSANRILMDVAAASDKVEKTMAMDRLGGVSVSFQISTSILPLTSFAIAGENVRFVFSPLFGKLFQGLEPQPVSSVYNGYIYDGAIKPIRESGRPAAVRLELQRHGAEFILCFFDESAITAWHRPYGGQDLISDYRFLLEWALADSGLGLVFKPKRSNLLDRLTPIAGLVEKAMATGRCRFLTTDAFVSGIYPAEAAMISDVCVGLLWGPTAVLEGRLAGIPGVLLDVEGLEDRPYYPWGKGKAVFEDWDSLKSAVQRYRQAPERFPEFGDWSPAIHNFDPFHNGEATLRMGQYIKQVYDALKHGYPKDEALALGKRWHEERCAVPSTANTIEHGDYA